MTDEYVKRFVEVLEVCANSGNDEWYPFTFEQGRKAAQEALIALEQTKPVLELTDARIQQLWNENADHTPNWNRHNAFARAIERELMENLND